MPRTLAPRDPIDPRIPPRRAKPRLRSSLAACLLACAPKPAATDDTSTAGTLDSGASDAAGTLDPSASDTATPTTTQQMPCSDEGGESTWDPGSPNPEPAACTDHLATDDCCCFFGFDGYAYDACPSEFTCSQVFVECHTDEYVDPDHCPADAIFVPCDEYADLDCALDALASGDAAAIRWRIFPNSDNPWIEDHELYLVGDGTAFGTSHYNGVDHDSQTAVVRRALRPAADYVQCKVLPSAAERFACLRDAQTGPILETCLPTSEAPGGF